MARVWHLMLLCWAWTPPCLPSSVSFIGSPRECEEAPFVPGYSLGGQGFDVVAMKRKDHYVIDTETWNLGDGTCKMYHNNYMNGEKQKVPAAVVDWTELPKCSLKVSGSLYHSVETLINESTSAVSNNWKLGLDIPVDPSASVGVGFGGSRSRASEFGMKKSKQDRYDFARHSVDCKVYNYKMSSNPPLSHEILSAVNSLPPYSHETRVSYRRLIDTYGTHYITQVSLGGEVKAITSVRTCKATMSGLTAADVSDCLLVEASANFPQSASVKAMYQHCQAKKKNLVSGQSFSSAFNERLTEVIGGDQRDLVLFLGPSGPGIYNKWVESLKTTPDVVQYGLKPLHTILPDDHKARNGLKQEVEKYIENNAVVKKCSESCPIGHRSSGRDPCACVCNGNQMVKSNCCTARKSLGTLKVFRLFAKKLYGDVWTQTDASVEVKFGQQVKRTAIIANNDNPTWKETFVFKRVNMDKPQKLIFTVYDEDRYWNSDLLGSCTVFLHKGRESDSCVLNHGTLYFSYELKCAPNLGGSHCDKYIPSPMSPSSAGVFLSRNGVLAEELGELEANLRGQSG